MSEAERLGLFGAMDPDARRQAVARTRVIRASKGSAILRRGDTSSDVFFVLDGRLQVLLYSVNGREVSIRDLGDGDMFGEMAAIDGELRSASIVALDDSRLLAMSRADFRSIIETSPQASMWLLGQLSAHLRIMTERVFELSALNVQARLHCELLRMAARSPDGLEVSPAPTHAELANRIGTHREAVTREMRALTAQNIIRTARRKIQFLDIARLQTSVGRLSLEASTGDRMADP
jgi:CRP-like cAMP-binding protein